MNKQGKRLCSLILAVVMMLSPCVGSLPAYAENTPLSDRTGICVHHPAHTAECGYVEAVEAQPCTHVHDETCGYGEETTPDTPSETSGNAEVVEEETCTHVHDETCGYAEAVAGNPCIYAVNGCPYCITAWSWIDPQENLTASGDSWGLGLPGVGETNPLTQEALGELLPTQITATTDSGDTLTLDLTWDLSFIPETGVTQGQYEVTAALTDTRYALTSDADPLAVTLQLSGGTTYTTLPSGDPPYSEHIINGVSPNGTTINLFDYWLLDRLSADTSNPTNFYNLGINKDHALLFTYQMTQDPPVGDWNGWTRGPSPYPGIVGDRLVNGYPQLALGEIPASESYVYGRDGNESLAYLFDPDLPAEGKVSYKEVQGLLQVDSDGYYYYDSQKNYAVFYEQTNSFTLYEYPGVLPGNGQSSSGQFFPFNEATADAVEQVIQGQTHHLMNTSLSQADGMNHYFGLHMSTRFIQQYGGQTYENSGTPVTYEFSGDDDVWIFIDDVLVADLGGLHNTASVKIDFSTGKITINGKEQGATLGELLKTGSATLPDNTYHTLDFFYLERGNTDSNLQLKYNLVTIPESALIKIDQLGDPVAGTEFTLYAADDYEKHGADAAPIATGTTDHDGSFVFLNEDEFPITLQSLYTQYGKREDDAGNNLILLETNTPSGYRSGGAIGLYFYQSAADEVLLLSNSIWDEGAYAMPKVTSTAPNVIRSADDHSLQVTLTGSNAVENPLMFAVVYQKQDDGTWLPVSGDPLKGWRVEQSNSWESVLKAATSNPYIFHLASSGAYQVEIDNLPGNIQTYYHICQDEDQAKYTIGYYYTTAKTLAQATTGNTWRIDSDPTDGQTQYRLDRVFSMDLYVTNIKNRLLVQKVDDGGNPVKGAQFSLYKAKDVTVEDDGSVTVHTDAQAYDSLTTDDVTGILNLEGGGIFPTNGHVLESGEYYLIETSAPTGYRLNDTAVHVVVDDTGVYADAGTARDGVTVLRGVGSVMRSLVQFAADDHVDTTLQGIKAALSSDVAFQGYDKEGSFTVADANWNEAASSVLHLQYENANSMLDYGLYGVDTPGTLDTLTLATEAGWSKLLIQQCYEHAGSVDALKTNLADLGYEDITNLFSGTVTVRVANARVGNLKIEKRVTGDRAPTGQAFPFTVTLEKSQNVPLSGTYDTVDGNQDSGSITFTQGTATVTLQADESLTILGLPIGVHYTVEETSIPDGFEASIQVTGDDTAQTDGATATGTIQHNTSEGEAVALTYTNHFQGSATVALKGTKTLRGRDLTAKDQYSFTLAPGDEDTEKAIEDGTIVLPQQVTATVTGDGTSSAEPFGFDEITFQAAGTYHFAIQEDLPQDATEDHPVSGTIRYDTHTAVVTVTVTEDPSTGILSAETVYSNAGAPSQDDAKETEQAAFTNTCESLTIQKTVTGNIGDRDHPFSFQITLTEGDGTPLTGSYDYTGDTVSGVMGAQAPKGGTLTLNDSGTATFSLQHGQSITILGLPADCRYTISEPEAEKDGYLTTVTVGTAPAQTVYTVSGTLPETETTLVAFENSRNSAPATGITLDNLPWLLAIGFGLCGGGALFFTKNLGQHAGQAMGIHLKHRTRRGKHDK